MYRERTTGRAGNPIEIVRIAAHHHVFACKRAHHHRCVDQISAAARGQSRSRRACLLLVKRLDQASPQQAGEAMLWAAAPCLAKHEGRYCRAQPPFKGAAVQGPERGGVSFRCNERSGVVRDSVHAAWPSDAASSTASAAARFSVVSRPCSASHSATPISPSSIARALRDAMFSHAERLIPRRLAAFLAASRTGSSSAMDSF